MATTIQEDEEVPASYPAAPSGLSAAAAALSAAMIWARIEAFTAWRYSARGVTWIVEGPGEWIAPLKPATSVSTYVWENSAWSAYTLPASPRGGYDLPGCGPYKITATLGAAATVPEIVKEAYRRLAEFYATAATAPGVRQENVDGIGSTEFDLNAIASAMNRSGAGDLLRSFRRVL
ncbi:hypothetical protein [Methylocystis echinoides]|uniref:Uncharacterized protein n=1 Tax=Methylocystis echinoides TaxID=29468 RepID=A0A9W6GW56_9HYPH|nr:hypothetical protein [Methylocystis echinoides]GLI93945.1 hypothetical protein LMG27198_29370 [Methylocystis echinoides]